MGSSPLTRGKHGLREVSGLGNRLIPAHAGKTVRGRSLTHPGGAHPRSRGENIRPMGLASMAAGSSPLTRGKPQHLAVADLLHGLIPAHAGKTAGRTSWRRPGPAHPRSRGENRMVADPWQRYVGSSPLTRGKLQMTYNLDLTEGLIPAHAGKTVSPSSISSLTWAHPRSRGENEYGSAQTVSNVGSSPLTRGKRKPLTLADIKIGLIPAHAGKTHSPRRPRWWRRAHPRSRGENSE